MKDRVGCLYQALSINITVLKMRNRGKIGQKKVIQELTFSEMQQGLKLIFRIILVLKKKKNPSGFSSASVY